MMPTVVQPDPHGHMYPQPTALTVPSKRGAEQNDDDDDIQFISENPVKRRRMDQKQQQPVTLPMPTEPTITPAAGVAPVVSGCPMAPTEPSASKSSEMDRRVSTGMVVLTTHLDPTALYPALRPVSMPELENYVFGQAVHQPRLPVSPALSPKSLPSSVPPPRPLPGAINRDTYLSPIPQPVTSVGAIGLNRIPTINQGEKPTGSAVIAPNPAVAIPSRGPGNGSKGSKTALHHTASASPSHIHEHASVTASDLVPTHSLCSTGHTFQSTAIPGPSLNEPRSSGQDSLLRGQCHVCYRLKHQAQGVPVANTSSHLHCMPQLNYHQHYNHHLRPQMLALQTNTMHPHGQSFPSMMPVNANAFAALPSHIQTQHQPQPHIQPYIQPSPAVYSHVPAPPQHPLSLHQSVPQSQETQASNQGYQDGNKEVRNPPARAVADQEPKNKQGKATASPSANKTTSSTKPPASLIPSNFRKRSPNLIVDVAEACVESFPFEEVAKRHAVPVDKVYEVFEAIIQVPLLRCPTDRRRPGRVATARIKEYNKAKKELQDSRTGGEHASGERRRDHSASASDIARRLGETQFPNGFRLDA
ncbi:hypothetical protein F5Y17DRAFT_438243 [Xylariaceae sp. FL0594]|nr:hypothetical protein F5Y17DRAFT_438243 [Xylariaceae sp. FL0594]